MAGGNMMLAIRRTQQDRCVLALLATVASVALATLSGCGGGGGGGSSTPQPPSSPQLMAIAVSPSNPLIHLGTVQQLVATGTYSDGSSQGVTTLASWSSSTTSVAR